MTQIKYAQINSAKQKDTLDWIRCVLCLCMIVGMISSRVILSISMILLLLLSLLSLEKAWIKWKKSKFAIASFTFFIAYLVSGIWSENLTYWFNSMITKLPFIILPFVFFTLPFHRRKYQIIFAMGLMMVLTVVVGYSAIDYLLNISEYNFGYSRSVSLTTTKYGDHIRFSLLLVSAILVFLNILFTKAQPPLHQLVRYSLIFAIFLFFVYLHLLSAKTGLLALYCVLFVFIMTKIAAKGKTIALLAILALGFIATVAFQYIPTLNTKVKYVLYEIDAWEQKIEGYYILSDNGRLISYEMAIKSIENNPMLGTGAGDIHHEVESIYRQYYPEIPIELAKKPHNQFLFTAMAVGIPLCGTLIFMFFAPLATSKGGNKLYQKMNLILMLVALSVEAMLEIQFGIFIYLFFTLYWNQLNEQYI